MQPLQTAHISRPDSGTVVAKAVIRAAEHLDLKANSLGRIIGLSEATISRLRRGDYTLDPASKPFELAVLFVRLFRSLDAIAGGDEKVARSWLINFNTVLGATPLEKICSISGLTDVIAYLDARRAVV